ncbi:MAG: methylated-DNA--[protein]-cysteine S-methyltransferase [Solirubrobacteraceae bacterium]
MTDRIERALRAPVPQASAASRRLTDRAASEGRADLCYTTFASPLGELLLVASRRGLARLHYVDGTLEETLDKLAVERSPRIVESAAALEPWRRELDQYFAGERQRFDGPLDWQEITGFRRRVLRATAAVPYGEAATYKKIATAAGSPRASRAAGNALGSNPLAIVIPCHRVLHTGGGLGGYTGGLERKALLLGIERAGRGS